MTMAQNHPRGRPAHTPGPSFLAYTPKGDKLITVGSNNAIRVFSTGSDAEPANIDDCPDGNMAVAAAAGGFFVSGAEDGTVRKYSLEKCEMESLLLRCTLPIRDIALSPDGKWAAVASGELVVKVVNTDDMTKVLYLREQPKSAKHVSFDHTGSHLAVSCSDGQIYVYDLSSEEPQLLKKLNGLIKPLEPDGEASSKVIWHPDGRAFAAATLTKGVQVVSKGDWEPQRAFTSGHTADITALAWSPNGALLVTTGLDGKLLLWDTQTQKIVKTLDDVRCMICALAWHPSDNTLSYTNIDGELFVHTDFVPPELMPTFLKDLQAAPFIHDPLSEVSGNSRPALTNGDKDADAVRRMRRMSLDSVDRALGSEAGSDDSDFISDDDGAGYAEEGINGNGKRAHDGDDLEIGTKRRATGSLLRPQERAAFQPGSTPWRGNRRYLCLNLIGFVWTIDQSTHHTITVEFYDREFQRDFHFTDPFLYDKACLNANGTLFASSASDPSLLYYRPHETWTARSDWRTPLPAGEKIISIALSESYVVAVTSADYVRIFTLFGTPVRVYRLKNSPAVTCAAWRDYVMTVGNGSLAADGRPRLTYSIENVRRDEMLQSEDTVALSAGAELESVFFSDNGDPYIYDSTQTLLTLLHWRLPGQARWVPILDTRSLSRLATGRKTESYWPVAVAQNRFHCIILKGGDTQPYFPRPLLSDFAFKIPIGGATAKGVKNKRDADDSDVSDDDEDDADETDTEAREIHALHASYLLHSLHYAQLRDSSSSSVSASSSSSRTALTRHALEADKALLQLLAAECRAGEERGMRALEIVALMRDRSGKMLEAARKVAGRFGREVLGQKIVELGERRMVGLEDEEDGEEGDGMEL